MVFLNLKRNRKKRLQLKLKLYDKLTPLLHMNQLNGKKYQHNKYSLHAVQIAYLLGAYYLPTLPLCALHTTSCAANLHQQAVVIIILRPTTGLQPNVTG